MRIVVVDDDPQIGRTIQLGWPDPGDQVEVFTSFEPAREALFGRHAGSVTCVVLDLKLPDASGSSILTEIRHTSQMPIIMLSGSGDSDFRTQMLLRGADDYVMKPVSVKELHARVLRLASRTASAPAVQNDPVDIGGVTFDPMTRRISSSSESQSLTEAESAILAALVYANGKPVARDDLYVKGFGRTYREGEKALETYIGRLRQKLTGLGEDGDARLLTARGIGYRLNK
ncbi:response regulator transcription factor [Hyphomonas sp.]|uniref:response regulator transcription factor n=1 Tax=Hyphomonas sp. TaxID=87 RepID=UPI00391938C3